MQTLPTYNKAPGQDDATGAGEELNRERRVLRFLLKFEQQNIIRMQRLTAQVMKAHLKYCDEMDRIMLQLDKKRSMARSCARSS